ncbi:hypothetical protein [Roseateles violae]|uniref:Uncharacterized protein n=1 Tax=Roseateles violae TaxID=3058042 RepID=A0ABT8E0F4_9BURK|nr:hypothetical protein [Pelomonas sp. PFR6]MDN3923325.1 hypothetical protein [Pelomonas sp. PFR6]
MKGLLPTGPAVAREALTVIAGALLAAAVMYQFPAVKAWVKKAWE